MPSPLTAPPIPLRRLVPAVLWLLAPTILAIDVMVFIGDLPVETALIVLSAALTGSAFVVWLFHTDLAAVGYYLRSLAEGGEGDMPDPQTGIVRDLTASIARLDRRWRTRYRAVQLRRSLDEDILETLHDPLFLLDAQRRILRANAAGRQLVKRFDAGRQTMGELIETLADRELDRVIEAVLAGAEPETVEIHHAAVAQGGAGDSWFLARPARFSPQRLAGDDLELRAELAAQYGPIAALVTLHEITERKRLERMRDDFIANISHELRTPLASMMAAIETVNGPARDDPEARDRFLAMMLAQGRRLTRLVSDLLALSRIELSEDEPPNRQVDLGPLLEEVVDALSLHAQRNDIALDLDRAVGPLAVRGDPDQLYQLFQNLVDNAIKYGRSGGRVTIGAGRDADGAITIFVADDGEGIAPEHVAHLTERFYRVNPGAAGSDGVGLGLAIVKHVVQRHQGELTIHSEPSRGSRFTVRLPAGDAAQPG